MDELHELADKVDRQKNRKAKLEGKLQVLMDQLKAMGYGTLEEAEADLKKRRSNLVKQKDTFKKKLVQFKRKYRKEISEL